MSGLKNKYKNNLHYRFVFKVGFSREVKFFFCSSTSWIVDATQGHLLMSLIFNDKVQTQSNAAVFKLLNIVLVCKSLYEGKWDRHFKMFFSKHVWL